MIFTAATRAGEVRRRSLPSDRIRFFRSTLRPSPAQIFASVGVPINPAKLAEGKADGLAGRPWRLTPADLLQRPGDPALLSYMLGYRAGEIERRSGVNATELACGQGGDDAAD